jgi:CRISPR-associated endonuclease/helicase Cas3
VDRFRGDRTDGFVLVSSQVAEMSLDISADLLVTDLAPVPALIQRMGRLNRRVTKETDGCWRPAIVRDLPGGSDLPYEKQDLSIAREWLASVTAKRIVSQQSLADAFRAVEESGDVDVDRADRNAIFISGWWQTDTATTRADGATIPVILEQDARNIPSAGRRATREWVRAHEVSIPIRNEIRNWETLDRGPRIAPAVSVRYDWNETTKRGTGAEWIK